MCIAAVAHHSWLLLLCLLCCAEYPKRLRKLLLTPEREVAVELALLRDNGEVRDGTVCFGTCTA